MTCKKCGNEMSVQLVAEKKRRGMLSTLFWLLLCVCTFGIILLLIPMLRGSKTKTVEYFVCQKCGYRVKR